MRIRSLRFRLSMLPGAAALTLAFAGLCFTGETVARKAPAIAVDADNAAEEGMADAMVVQMKKGHWGEWQFRFEAPMLVTNPFAALGKEGRAEATNDFRLRLTVIKELGELPPAPSLAKSEEKSKSGKPVSEGASTTGGDITGKPGASRSQRGKKADALALAKNECWLRAQIKDGKKQWTIKQLRVNPRMLWQRFDTVSRQVTKPDKNSKLPSTPKGKGGVQFEIKMPGGQKRHVERWPMPKGFFLGPARIIVWGHDFKKAGALEWRKYLEIELVAFGDGAKKQPEFPCPAKTPVASASGK